MSVNYLKWSIPLLTSYRGILPRSALVSFWDAFTIASPVVMEGFVMYLCLNLQCLTLLFSWYHSSTPSSIGNVLSMCQHSNQSFSSYPRFFVFRGVLTFGYLRQGVPMGAYWNHGRHWGRSMSITLGGCLSILIDLFACPVVEIIRPICQGGRWLILHLGHQWCVLSMFTVLVLQDFACVGLLELAHTPIHFLLWLAWILLKIHCPAHVTWV